MSTRIIIENDGERWISTEEIVAVYDEELHTMAISAAENDDEAVIYVKPLPPVVRTDNSDVIARLEAENAELKKTIEDNLRVSKACSESDYDEKAALREERARLLQENAKLREALKDMIDVVNRRVSVISLLHESETIYKAQAIMKGGAE